MAPCHTLHKAERDVLELHPLRREARAPSHLEHLFISTLILTMTMNDDDDDDDGDDVWLERKNKVEQTSLCGILPLAISHQTNPGTMTGHGRSLLLKCRQRAIRAGGMRKTDGANVGSYF